MTTFALGPEQIAYNGFLESKSKKSWFFIYGENLSETQKSWFLVTLLPIITLTLLAWTQEIWRFYCRSIGVFWSSYQTQLDEQEGKCIRRNASIFWYENRIFRAYLRKRHYVIQIKNSWKRKKIHSNGRPTINDIRFSKSETQPDSDTHKLRESRVHKRLSAAKWKD